MASKLRPLLPLLVLLASAPFLAPHLHEARNLGPLPFAVAYAVAMAVGLPCLVLAAGAGACLGAATGFLAVVLGEVLGAALCYSAGRLGGSESLRNHPRLEPLVRHQNGFTIALIHLIPVLPFNLINYACGLLKMNPATFLLGTFVGVLPGSALAVLSADLIAAASQHQPLPPDKLALLAVVVTLFVTLLVVARRYVKRLP